MSVEYRLTKPLSIKQIKEKGFDIEYTDEIGNGSFPCGIRDYDGNFIRINKVIYPNDNVIVSAYDDDLYDSMKEIDEEEIPKDDLKVVEYESKNNGYRIIRALALAFNLGVYTDNEMEAFHHLLGDDADEGNLTGDEYEAFWNWQIISAMKHLKLRYDENHNVVPFKGEDVDATPKDKKPKKEVEESKDLPF